jgi:pimeloyl-ACP methyl ester carboxylesterase
MKNVSDTEAYTVYDFVFSKAVRSLSHLVGVRKLTRPFWNRWRASNIGDETIFRFLDGVGTIDDWPVVGARIATEEIAAFKSKRATHAPSEVVAGLRRLSYLCNMAQWGTLPLSCDKIDTYRQCRDYYIEAETLAFGENYKRLEVPWFGKSLFGNVHIPTNPAASEHPSPVVVIVHGIDGCKEEHLATELALLDAGLCVLGIDGPGQAEALLLNGILWTEHFYTMVGRALEELAMDLRVDTSRVGLFGISIGGMWALRAASGDRRIKALYDLGGPINARAFPRLPFLIKTKLCQVTGAREAKAIADVLGKNAIEDDDVLATVTAAVRIVHGARDRVVSIADKEWLCDKLLSFQQTQDVSLVVIPDGDHCCTGHADWIRQDMVNFFSRTLTSALAA